MHHIYHTEGIILSSQDLGEDNRRYAIFTRELGLIYARATGVRKMHSKLRFVLQDFAYIKADLVQGKNYWRVTSASKTGKLEHLTKNKTAMRVFTNIAALLERLLPRGETNELLFADFFQGLNFLEQAKKAEDFNNIEITIVLRALNHLGYIGEGAPVDNFIKSPLEAELVYRVTEHRRALLREINQALRESHL